jgi:hypothetical protein
MLLVGCVSVTLLRAGDKGTLELGNEPSGIRLAASPRNGYVVP